jgi:hypothetical protein
MQLAQKIMQPFVGDSLTPERLLELTTKAYGRFAHAAVTPLKQFDERSGCSSCSTARRWRSRTWRCNCWACCSRNSCRVATIT